MQQAENNHIPQSAGIPVEKAHCFSPGALAVIDGEPRMKDTDIGAALGMAQPRNIRAIIDKNRAELERYGLVHVARSPITSGKGRVQEVTTYHLNEGQAILLCMFSRTPTAAAVRHQIVTVFMAWRRGELEKVPVKAHTRRKAAPKVAHPAASKEGVAVAVIGGEVVTFDTNDYDLRDGDWAVVLMGSKFAKMQLTETQGRSNSGWESPRRGWVDYTSGYYGSGPREYAEVRIVGRMLSAVRATAAPAIAAPQVDAARFDPKNRHLVSFGSDGKMEIKAVGPDACVVSGANETNLYTFLREFVPVENLPVAFDVICQRMKALACRELGKKNNGRHLSVVKQAVA